MKNDTTIHTTLNIRYTGKNWQLSSYQINETLQLSRHPQPRLPPQPSNVRAEKQDGWMVYEEFRRIMDDE